MKMIYNVEDKPAWSKLLVFAFQQVLAIMAATIAVPAIIGLPAQMPAAILGAGVGTIVYLLFTRFKSPVCISSSFAFLSSLFVALTFGYLGIIVGGILAGLVYVIIAIVIHFVGTKWVSKLMPPVIIGPTVALIGLGLAGNAMGDLVKANASVFNGGYNWVAILCGLATFITIIICSIQKKKKGLRLIPFICGIGVGYALALIFTGIGYAAKADYLMVLDWSPIVENFKNVTVTSFLDYPHFALVEGIKEIANGNVLLTAAGFGEIALAFIPVALVVFAEHIADHKNLGSIIERDLVEGEPGLKRTLLGDGVGSIAGTILGICPNTTYGESVGCVAITRNASVRTIFVAACMCIVLSFLKPLMVILQTIPSCVMGGVCLTLYGFIAVSGLKMFKDIDLGENKNLFTVSTILIAGIGGLSIQIPYAVDGNGTVTKVITVTSIATALILGICVHAIINAIEKKEKDIPDDDEAESLMAAPIESGSTYEVGGEEAKEEEAAPQEEAQPEEAQE
ncbi:MAG: uracil-xanthine permease [Clostridia bacterium]|nr:uracil-xanthine permease [Clostridia bacterium]